MVQLGLRLKGPSVMVVEFIQYLSARMSSEAVDIHIQLKLNGTVVMFVMYVAIIIIFTSSLLIVVHFYSLLQPVKELCKESFR